jgi:hypothetical protein
VYEVWGWTTESKAWLFVVLVPELPPGMPVGTDVYERVSFAGYFYKLQGYQEAGAGPRDKPLPAPLLIGRLTWKPSDLRVARSQPQDWTWAWWVGGIALVFGILRAGLWLSSRRRRTREVRELAETASTGDPQVVRNWLADFGGDARDSARSSHQFGDASQPFPDFHNN